MANIVLDFLHNYQTGERRETEPANAYQYDEGHVLEAVLPEVITSCEIHYWIRGMDEADAYEPGSITPNEDGSCTVLGNIPNKYFETNGELRIYIVVTDGTASITTYEGKLHICQRSQPDDYVDDDPDNEAVRVITEAQAAAATATEKAGEAAASAEQAQEILDSIPEDYTELTEEVSNLKDDLYNTLVTDTAGGSIASFSDGADNVPVKSLTVAIEPVQSGTGDPSPTNIRPISGHTQAKVTRTGFNLFMGNDTSMSQYDGDYLIGGNGDKSANGSYNCFKIKVAPSTAYCMSRHDSSNLGSVANKRFLDASGNFISADITGWNSTIGVFTTPSNCRFIEFSMGKTSSVLICVNTSDANRNGQYEPYTAQTVAIDLDGTIYGGTLDVTTGVLTVDRYMCDLQNTYPYLVSSQTDSVAVASLYLLDPAVALPSSKPGALIPLISNRFSSDIESGIPGRCVLVDDHIYFVISKSELTSVDYIGIREWISNHPTQMCYGLATPQAIQLTAQEVRTLLGQNNVFADCGDVSVEYRADTKLYIQKVLNA